MMASLASRNLYLFLTLGNKVVFRRNTITVLLWYCKHSGDESL